MPCWRRSKASTVWSAESPANAVLMICWLTPAASASFWAAVNFSVTNPLPAITTLSPSTALEGGAAFTLTVNGTGFVSGATVNFNGTAATTTFVSATQLTAAITAPEIATAGTLNVTVRPTPSGTALLSANTLVKVSLKVTYTPKGGVKRTVIKRRVMLS